MVSDTFIQHYTLGISEPLEFCDSGDRDPLYGISWERTAVNSSDNKPCPAINGRSTVGRVFRTCLPDKKWDSFVNVSYCQTQEFTALLENAVSTHTL